MKRDEVKENAQLCNTKDLLKSSAVIEKLQYVPEILNLLPFSLCIMNDNREIVFANTAFLNITEYTTVETVYGRRPGEVLGCENVVNGADICGTKEACEFCGILRAFTCCCFHGEYAPQECQFTRKDKESMDFRIHMRPLHIENNTFYICIMEDVSDEKRRLAFERIFFHDILNTVGGIAGLADVICADECDDEGDETYMHTLQNLSHELVEDVISQRDLIAAENKELVVNICTVDIHALIHKVRDMYRTHSAAENREICVVESSEACEIVTDKRLLTRVIGNMVKNALEATTEGMTVTIGYRKESEGICIYVTNPGLIDTAVRHQIFKRSFSTKGKGRGLGTYSMRLLTEKYLDGRVEFTSTAEDGTTFYCYLTEHINNRDINE